jgi:hypothetical protein
MALSLRAAFHYYWVVQRFRETGPRGVDTDGRREADGNRPVLPGVPMWRLLVSSRKHCFNLSARPAGCACLVREIQPRIFHSWLAGMDLCLGSVKALAVRGTLRRPKKRPVHVRPVKRHDGRHLLGTVLGSPLTKMQGILSAAPMRSHSYSPHPRRSHPQTPRHPSRDGRHRDPLLSPSSLDRSLFRPVC